MKQHRRNVLDERISGTLRSAIREQPIPAGLRFQLLHSALSGEGPDPQLSGQRTPPNWITPSNARRMENKQHSVQERKYGYMLTTASFRLAW